MSSHRHNCFGRLDLGSPKCDECSDYSRCLRKTREINERKARE
jgi:hypothetical protein